jgi:hypothetical protein
LRLVVGEDEKEIRPWFFAASRNTVEIDISHSLLLL